MPRTAKPADIARVVKASNKLISVWADANQAARAYFCKAKRGKPVVETIAGCQIEMDALMKRIGYFIDALTTLEKATSRLPAKHRIRLLGEAIAKPADARLKALYGTWDKFRDRQDKFTKQLQHIKHK